MTIMPSGEVWSDAINFAKAAGDRELTHNHVMMALVERPDVQAMITRSSKYGVDSALTLFHAVRPREEITAAANNGILACEPARQLLRQAGLLRRVQKNGQSIEEITQPILTAIEKQLNQNTEAAIGHDERTGARRFVAPISFKNMLTCIGEDYGVVRNFLTRDLDLETLQRELAQAETAIIKKRAMIRPPAGRNPRGSDLLLELDAKAWTACHKQDTNKFYALNLYSEILDAVDHPLLKDDMGVKVLVKQCTQTAKDRQDVIWDMVNEDKWDQKHGNKKEGTVERYQSMTKLLENTPLGLYGRDLTAAASNNVFDPVIGRDSEMERTIRTLCKRTLCNPCFVGEPGVGKTALAEGLAQRIVAGDVPKKLQNKTVIALDVNKLVAGTKYRGEFEKRAEDLIEQLKKLDRKVILYIDEVHNVLGAGSAEGSLDLANILKPALSRGEFQMMSSTTLDEYRKHIEKDEAFASRVDVIDINEPDDTLTLKMINGVLTKYEAFHETIMPQDVRETMVEGSGKHLDKNKANPRRSIDLADALLTRAELAGHSAVLPQDYYDEIFDRTGKKVGDLENDDHQTREAIEAFLNSQVLFQEKATASVAAAIERSRMGVSDDRLPVGSFLFLGDTGVGKTLLAKKLAEYLFGSEDQMIKIDGSELVEKHSISKLIGPPPGYVGFEDEGQLTGPVRRKPYSVVLFDEIEKAHEDLYPILLQVMNDGYLHDSHGRKIDFSKSIIIMTGNVLKQNAGSKAGVKIPLLEKLEKEPKLSKNMLDELIEAGFRMEFLGRTSEIIIFHKLTEPEMGEILKLTLKGLKPRPSLHNLEINASKEVMDHVKSEGDIRFGTRFYKRAVDRILGDAFAIAIKRNRTEPDSNQSLDPKVPTRADLTMENGSLKAIFTKLSNLPKTELPTPTPEQNNDKTPPPFPIPNVA